MSSSLLIPLVLTVMATVLGGVSQRFLQPALASWALTLTAALTVVALLSALGMVLVGFVHAAPGLGDAVAWCFHGGAVPWWETLVTITWLGCAGTRLRLTHARYRRLAPRRPAPEVEVVATAERTAYTLPGRQGRIVVSSGMLDALDDAERAVLFAHERSHLRRRHDRFIYVVDLAVAILPPLGFMSQRVRFATERWADEDAARSVGDRNLVARTIAKAALMQSNTTPGLALASRGVPARVKHLLHEPPSKPALCIAVAMTTALAAVALAGSSLQVHHLAMVAEHLCGWS